MGGRTHQGGSYAIWDSTRGILDRDTFPLALGRSSRDEPRDDVYPRKVRIVAHMGRGWSPDATLRRRMETGQTEMLVNSTAAFPPADSETARYVKVGREWMLISNMDSSSAKVVRHSRGSRKARKPLDVASPVFAGRVFRKTLDLPATRSNWMGDSR